jgi:hypothetical protein
VRTTPHFHHESASVRRRLQGIGGFMARRPASRERSCLERKGRDSNTRTDAARSRPGVRVRVRESLRAKLGFPQPAWGCCCHDRKNPHRSQATASLTRQKIRAAGRSGLLVIGVLGFLVLPPLVKWLLVDQLSTLLHRPVTVEE